ncbi:MAG: 1-deoxy-D-xylulose-5-phosphate reductoisomerase [Verrucomicrobiota bacterium]
MRKNVVILGSTGSIGTSALKVAGDIPDRMNLIGLAANRSHEALARQVARTGVKHAAIFDEEVFTDFRSAVPSETEIGVGMDGLIQLATLPDADIVLVAIIGVDGQRPALAALEAGKDIAVASKEILVMAGEIVMRTAAENGCRVLPVDSEHNAIFQCLEGKSSEDVQRLILTASGGPFRQLPADQLAGVTKEQALKHPTWDMGRKITIDSATLFNKGLEMIEARWLFGVEMERVDVIVHPQSIVHSMVEFIDGSVLAQLSVNDMCFPIQYAITWPDRVPNTLAPLDFGKLGKLDFETPRRADFPALDLATEAGKAGGSLPAVLNAANEVAVAAFLEEKISFPRIWETVATVMSKLDRSEAAKSLDEIVAADGWARDEAGRLVAD